MHESVFQDKVINEYYHYVKAKKVLSLKELSFLLKLKDKIDNTKFIDGYLYYVFIFAYQIYIKFQKYLGVNYSLIDLIQDGNLLLLEMIKSNKYDNYQVFSYAFYDRLMANLERKIMPLKKCFRIERYISLQNVKDTFYRINQKEATIDELSQLTGLSQRTVTTLLLEDDFSIDEVSDEELSFYIGYSDFENEYAEKIISLEISSNNVIDHCLGCLDDREKEIIIKLYGLFGTTKEKYHEIANQYGISVRLVYYIRDFAVKKMLRKNYNMLNKYR